MATGLLETGPKLNWTRDNKIFDRYQIWKEKVELIFSSALEESSAKQKVSYLRYWMGEQGIPLIKKWTALGKLDFSNSVETPTIEGARRIPLSSGYVLQNYWDLLEAEFRPKEMTSTMQKIHYASYEKKKGTGKKQKNQSNSNVSSSSSSRQKQDSTGSQKLCYQCKKSFTKGHEKVCKALNAKCNACGIVGHFKVACKKSGNFPQKSSSKFQKSGSTGRMNIASALKEPALQADFFDEKGLLKECQPKSMHVLSGTSNDKPIMIEFGCGLTPLSFDRKLTLQADTGADTNAINKKTFNEVFPDVELEESTYVL